MQDIRKILRGQRGDYLATSMIGAFISLLVLGVVAAGIMGTSAFQAQLAVRSAVTNQASLTDSSLRTDLIWASKIDAKDSTGFTATVPGTDGGCRVSEWAIKDSAEGNVEIVNTVYNYESFNPDTNPVTCSGDSTGRIDSTLITNAAPNSAFTYRNTAGYELTYKDGQQEARTHDLSSKPASISTVNWKSTKLEAVTLDTVVGYGTDTATPFRFSQSASNLDVVSNTPDGRPNFQAKGSLAAVEEGAVAFNYAGSTTFDSSAASQYLSPTASGGKGPYTFTVDGGAIPGGVTFDKTTGSFKGPAVWKPQVKATSTGLLASCAIAEQELYCWGAGLQAGNGAAGTVAAPTKVAAFSGKDITEVSVGRSHVCAVADGDAYCWGSSQHGRLGNGIETNTIQALPAKVQGDLTGKTVTAVSAGFRNTCAIADGKAYCWGEGQYGSNGNGDVENASKPVPVTAAGTIGGATVTDITVGWQAHACAVAGSKAYCWGALGADTSAGALGHGKAEGSAVPVAVSLPGKPVTEIGAGHGTTCAIAANAVHCWGENGYGRVGSGNSIEPILTPTAVKTAGTPLAGQVIKGLSVGYFHSCVVVGESSGSVSCWGSGAMGQMGNGAVAGNNPQPQALVAGVLAGRNVSSISAGWDATCAVVDGAVFCWGNGGNAILGNGVTANVDTPVPATGLTGNPGYPVSRTVTIKDAAGKTVKNAVTLWLE